MLLKEPYNTTVVIGSLKELLEENRSGMENKTDSAKTRFEFAGTIDWAQVNRSLKLKASVAGENLDAVPMTLGQEFSTYAVMIESAAPGEYDGPAEDL
jgi:hypothetical protein